jgi:glycosyltransferase involved in cell wall biosynthesis
MGKNNKKSKAKPNNKPNKKSNTIIDNNSKYPFVSVCTPTFNRRPFISGMLKCFNHQTYPTDRMEWIIIDDGTDKIEDLVKDHPNVKYFAYDTKMSLGRKRNLLHEKSKGDIIVYMDDDDYYPPERVSHAVETLQSNKKAICAGSSEIYIYFKHIQKMYQFGPYGPNHATAGTFAFRRKLIENKYDDDACIAEEKVFLKDYTVPFVQLNPINVILVISHEHNTFDKRKLLENPHQDFVKESDKKVEDFIKEPELVDFYMNIDSVLKTYEPGRPSMKPDVLEQIIKIEEQRRQRAENMIQSNNGQIMIQDKDGNSTPLNNNQAVEIMKTQQQQLQHQQSQLTQIKSAFEKIVRENMELKKILKGYEIQSGQISPVN